MDNPNPRFAPHLHIAEVLDSHLVFRLIGTKLVERLGRDKTGEVIGLGQPPKISNALFENSRLAIALPCGFLQIIEFAASNGAHLSVEAIVLPLGVQAGKQNRLVAFSDVLQKLKYGDQTERYLGLPFVSWIDIGAGVPEQEPFAVKD